MPKSFSAGPQALGYLYQARAALLLILQCPDEAEVRIEGLDDIQINDPASAQTLKLSQLKHHVSKKATLTDYSEDLWKTIRVWATHVASRRFALSDTRLYLITTAQAPPGSIASLLGAGSDRDPEQAEKKLSAVAATSKNKELKPSFQAFADLPSTSREALVRSIYVLDEQEQADAYQQKIKSAIRPAVRREHLEGLYERVEGWWFDHVVRHLMSAGSADTIRAFDVNEKIAEIAEGFHHENLPIDFLDESPDESYIASSREKLFVRQLQAIEVRPRTVTKAILDYYRAFSQRSRWLKDGLVVDEELSRFERALIDEWERYCDALRDENAYDDESSEEALINFGRKVLRWAELQATHLRIRPRVEADFVRRGSFHLLADREPTPSLYWHPQFLQRMAQTVARAASGGKS